MNELQVFQNDQFGQVRTIEENGKVLFCGKDVAAALGYSNPRDALIRHCKGVVKRDTLTSGGTQEISYITESDLYRLIAASQLPNAQKFESWIFDEVLPSIQKHGGYLTPAMTEEILLNPDTLIMLANEIKAERAKRKEIEAVNAIMLPKAEYFDELVDRNLLTSFRETAKELGIKEKDLINFLMGKYIYRDKKGRLMPYAEKNDGLFELKECFSKNSNWAGVQTLVTPKGRETFRLLFSSKENRA